MRTFFVLALCAACAGCAHRQQEPLTPQQEAFIQQWTLDRARAADQAAQKPAYQIGQPVQLSTPAQVLQPVTVQAFFTGRSQPAQSVTGMFGTNCEYSYGNQRFWRMVQGACPYSVAVQ